MRRLLQLTVSLLLLQAAASPAHARAQTRPARRVADLDGQYLYLAPTLSLLSTGEGRIGSLGATAAWLSIREDHPLTAAGLEIGALRQADLSRTLTHLGLSAGQRLSWGPWWGLSGGLHATFAADAAPTYGALARVWIFVGAVPYLGVRRLDAETWWEVGLTLPLPAYRR